MGRIESNVETVTNRRQLQYNTIRNNIYSIYGYDECAGYYLNTLITILQNTSIYNINQLKF